jgi:hypothetical protein
MKNSKYTIPKLHKSQYCEIKWARACGTFEVRRGDRCGASAEVQGVSDDAIRPGVFFSRSIISHTKGSQEGYFMVPPSEHRNVKFYGAHVVLRSA